MSSLLKVGLSGLVITCTLSIAQAGTIVRPIDAWTDLNTSINSPISNLHNMSGLSDPYISGVTDFDSYTAVTTHNYLKELEWQTTKDIDSGFLYLDLGQDYSVDKFALWNEDFQGVKDFEVSWATNSSPSNWSSSIQFPGTFNTYNVDYLPQVYEFSGSTLARYFRINILDSYDRSTQLFDNVGIGEIAFSANPVPEPTTLFLLGGGLVTLLGLRRRR